MLARVAARIRQIARRRRMRRFLEQELHQLAQEARRLDCPAVRQELRILRASIRGDALSA